TLGELPLRSGDAVHVRSRDLASPRLGASVASWVRSLPSSTLVTFELGSALDTVPWEVQERLLRRCDELTAPAAAINALEGTSRPKAAWKALDVYAPRVAVTVVRTGADGCWVATPDDPPVEVPAPPTDAPGGLVADEVHTGVLLAGLARGLPPTR